MPRGPATVTEAEAGAEAEAEVPAAAAVVEVAHREVALVGRHVVPLAVVQAALPVVDLLVDQVLVVAALEPL